MDTQREGGERDGGESEREVVGQKMKRTQVVVGWGGHTVPEAIDG